MIRIGKFFNSVDIVILMVLMWTAGLAEATGTLLFDSYARMHWINRTLSSILMAVVIDGFILVLSVNINLLNPWLRKALPFIFSIFAIVMSLFFFGAFDEKDSTMMLIQKCFLSFMIGTIHYTMSELFTNKWAESVKGKTEIEILRKELELSHERRDELADHLSQKDHEIMTMQSQIDHLRSLDYDRVVIERDQLIIKLSEIQKRLARPKPNKKATSNADGI